MFADCTVQQLECRLSVISPSGALWRLPEDLAVILHQALRDTSKADLSKIHMDLEIGVLFSTSPTTVVPVVLWTSLPFPGIPCAGSPSDKSHGTNSEYDDLVLDDD